MDGIDVWNIALCDDDAKFSLALADMLDQVSQGRAKTSIFTSGTLLLEEYDRQKRDVFDMIFLDVEMPGMNGISVTDEIKQRDQGVIVIIVTNYAQYAVQAFTARVFHYLVKPLTFDSVAKVYLEAVEELTSDKRNTLVVPGRREVRQVRFAKIFYIESFADRLELHTAYEKIAFYCTLKKMEDLLRGLPFARVHKSFIVNLSKIDYIDKNCYLAVLFDGTKIPISRKAKNINALLLKMVELAGARIMDSKRRKIIGGVEN